MTKEHIREVMERHQTKSSKSEGVGTIVLRVFVGLVLAIPAYFLFGGLEAAFITFLATLALIAIFGIDRY